MRGADARLECDPGKPGCGDSSDGLVVSTPSLGGVGAANVRTRVERRACVPAAHVASTTANAPSPSWLAKMDPKGCPPPPPCCQAADDWNHRPEEAEVPTRVARARLLIAVLAGNGASVRTPAPRNAQEREERAARSIACEQKTESTPLVDRRFGVRGK